MAMTSKTEKKQKRYCRRYLQDEAFAEIKPSATSSLGRIAQSNFSGCLDNPTLNLQTVMGENADSHDEPLFFSYRKLDRDFMTVLVFSFRDIEYRED